MDFKRFKYLQSSKFCVFDLYNLNNQFETVYTFHKFFLRLFFSGPFVLQSIQERPRTKLGLWPVDILPCNKQYSLLMGFFIRSLINSILFLDFMSRWMSFLKCCLISFCNCGPNWWARPLSFGARNQVGDDI